MYPTTAANPTPMTDKVQTQTHLNADLSEIDKAISSCFEAVTRLDNCYSRLMNPKPQEAAVGQGQAPTPSTIQGRLQDAMRGATLLSQRLHDLANQFEKAV